VAVIASKTTGRGSGERARLWDDPSTQFSDDPSTQFTVKPFFYSGEGAHCLPRIKIII